MVDPLLAGDRAAAPRTLVDVLADVTARHPDAPALDDTVTVLTYAELTEQARRMAAELVAAGVRRGDRVGVRVPSGTTDLYVAVLGVLHAGAAYVPVDVDDPQERADLVFSEAAVTAVVGARRQITVPSPGSPVPASGRTARRAAPRPARAGRDGRHEPGRPAGRPRARRRLGDLHLGVDRRAQGRRRLPPFGGGLRRR